MTSENKNEIECYALHVLQSNDLKTVMKPEVAKAIKDCSGYPVLDDGFGVFFLATLVFLDVEERLKCGKKLEEMGIKVAYAIQKCYVDKKYIRHDIRAKN